MDLLNDIIDQIVYLKPTIIITMVGTILMMIYLLVNTRQFSWQSKNIKIVGFCYAMKNSDATALAACLLKFFLAISLLFYGGTVNFSLIIAYGVLTVAYLLGRRKASEILGTVFNAVVIMASLYIADFLISYLKKIYFDKLVCAALVLLIIFIILYTVYDLVGCMSKIITGALPQKEIEESK